MPGFSGSDSFGYTVSAISENILYVMSGLNLFVNSKNVYENWVPDTNAKVNGYRMAHWSDQREFQTDEWWAASYRLRDATDRLEVGFNDEEKAS